MTLTSVVGLALGGTIALAAPASAVPVNRINVVTNGNVQQVSKTATTKATATVRGGGRVLAGKVVTFSVDRGFVSATKVATSTELTTLDATTNANGVASVFIGSTTKGSQAVTGTSEGQSDVSFTTYAADPAAVSLTPADTTIEAGKSQVFTATVTDGADTPVSGATVDFTNSEGPGTLSAPSGTTDEAGQAAVTLTTAKTDSGSGTVFANVEGGNVGDSSTYTLGPVVIGDPATVTVGGAGTTAQVSRTTTSAVTATVTDDDGDLVPNTDVVFSVDLGFVGATAEPADTTTTTVTVATNASGVATAHVGSTTAGTQNITAVAGTATGSGSDTYLASPAELALTPATATIEAGKSQVFTATVTDGAGNPVVGATVNFSNGEDVGTLSATSGTTGTDGTATVTLTTAKTDTGSGTVVATNGEALSASSTYTLGPVVIGPPATVVVSSAIAGQVSKTDTTPVTATVTDDDGDLVAGQQVTFTVGLGFVSATATPANTTDTTVTATTGADGVATAYVGSTLKGSQTITATAGEASGTASKTYYANADSITLTPTTAAVTAGTKQVFTATVKDVIGNPVTDAGVSFSIGDGPGILNGSSVLVDANGQARITLITALDDAGSGVLTASTYSPAGSPTATADYTVAPAAPPVTVQTVTVAPTTPNAGIDSPQVTTITVTNSDGSKAANTEVDVLVSGSATANGTVTTNASGVATFSFTPRTAGAFTVKAIAGGRSGTASGTTGLRHVTTTLVLTSPTKGQVIASVSTAPVRAGVKVAYYLLQGKAYVLYKTGVTTSKGGAAIAIPVKSGTTVSLVAKIYNDPTSDSVYSAPKSIKAS